ncbi:peptidylprolyl isomerase, partial [bacterium]|nr:peptidylprolyl isomerase [bacterium]
MSRFARFAFVLLVPLALVGAGCSSSATTTATTTPAVTAPPAKTIDTNTVVEQPKFAFPGVLPAEEIQNKQIRIHTSKGDVVFSLYPDTAPMAVSNFVYLAKAGYYDGLTFHRYVPGFVIQGGDPTGTGMGGPGYKFKDELNDTYGYDRGVLAMANSGPNTNGSQFFVMLKDTPISPMGMGKLYTI